MSGADERNRAMDAIERADAKRARKAAKREEDARRSAEGRGRPWSDPFAHWSSRPLGIWDREERWWFYVLSAGHSYGSGLATRWRPRLEHRRSLPWVGPGWLASSQVRGAFAARIRRGRLDTLGRDAPGRRW